MLLFHLGKIRHKYGVTCLSERFGNSDEIQTVLACRVHAMDDEDWRVRLWIAINIDGNTGMGDRLMRNSAHPSIQCCGMPENLQGQKDDQQRAAEEDHD